MTLASSLLALMTVSSLVAAAPPQRVISIGSAITEIVYELEQAHRLVAVDQTSQYPAPAQSLPDVGYLRTLSPEPILAMKPDLVLASAEAGPPLALAQIRAAGVPVIMVPGERSRAGVEAKVRTVATALEVSPSGEQLVAHLTTAFAAHTALSAAQGSYAPRVLCLMSLGNSGLAVAGRDTAADAFVTLAGGRNAFNSHPGYRSLAPEVLAGAAFDYVMVTARSVEAVGGLLGLLQQRALRVSKLEVDRIIVIDDAAALGFGPRLPASLTDVSARLFPGQRAADRTP